MCEADSCDGGTGGGSDDGGTGGGAAGCDAGVGRTVLAEPIALYGANQAMIALDPLGNVWMAENYALQGGPRVTQVLPDGGRVIRIPNTQLQNVTGLAFDLQGNLLVSDGAGNGFAGNPGANRVLKLAPDGGLSVFANLSNPVGIAVAANGEIYVASWSGKDIHRFSASGTDLGTFGSPFTDHPAGIAFDAQGNLFVGIFALNGTISGGSNIYRLDPQGQRTLFANPGLVEPAGMAFDPNGRLWVGYYDALKLIRFDPDGGSTIIPGGWTGDDAVNGVAVSPQGDVFLTVNGGRTTTGAALLRVRGAARPGCP